MVERLLPTTEIPSSNRVAFTIMSIEKPKNNEKEAVNGPILKTYVKVYLAGAGTVST